MKLQDLGWPQMSGLCPPRNRHFDQRWFNSLTGNLSSEIKGGKTSETRNSFLWLKDVPPRHADVILNHWLQNLFLLSGRYFQKSCLFTRVKMLATVPWWTQELLQKVSEVLGRSFPFSHCLPSHPFPCVCTCLTCQGWDLLLTRWFTANLLSTPERHQTALSMLQLNIGSLPHWPFVFSSACKTIVSHKGCCFFWVMSSQLAEHCLTFDVCLMCLRNVSQMNLKDLLSWDEFKVPPHLP